MNLYHIKVTYEGKPDVHEFYRRDVSAEEAEKHVLWQTRGFEYLGKRTININEVREEVCPQ